MTMQSKPRRNALAAVAIAALGVAWLTTAPHAEVTNPPQLSPEVRASFGTPAPWVGVGGCAAAACHGGEVEKPRGEYTTWISRDPHSRAYSVLFNESSLQMARQLAGGNPSKSLPPHEDQRCLACHAPTGPESERTPQIVGDGVGCEACHGGAETWAAEHATIDWKSLSPVEKKAKRRSLGMTDTRDLLVRTQQCVRCHVGEGEADVTHDLIAAGHPRLSFEMGTFHDQMPKHWSNEAERRADRAFEAKLWALGQVTAATTHFELLAARAKRGQGIELANYDCYACHHALQLPSQRPTPESGAAPGALRPLHWYMPSLNVWDFFESDDFQSYLKEDPTTTVGGILTGRLSQWAMQLEEARWDRGAIEKIMSQLASPPQNPTWDHATQWYLAIVALERARLDHFDTPPTGAAAERDQQVQSQLQAIKELLNFPAGEAGQVLNSPRDFDPQAFTTAAQRLHAIIQTRTASGESP
jgi:hypothetical protein